MNIASVIRDILLIFLCISFTFSVYSQQKAKNVILLIADGTGVSQISAGMYAKDDFTSNYERFRSIGFHKQHSSSNLITDSAAGATAFACGVKTFNYAIGVNKDTVPVKTILEEAEEKGLSTGMVATSTIVHATPASFISHVKYRKMYEEIAEDFLKTDIDYFVGGGMKYFTRREKDNRNIANELEKKGYTVKSFLDKDISEMDLDLDKFAYFTADKDPLPRFQGRDYLIPASMKGIDFLNEKNENGFFMMLEGSQIDWGGHANNGEWLVDEMKEFDDLVGKVLDWAEADGETLVIVTGDHECGGLAIDSDSKKDSLVLKFTSDYHTGDMIPVFAYGPGAEDFQGIYENSEIFYKMRNAFGWAKRTPAKK